MLRRSAGDRVIDLLIYLLLIVIGVITLYPFINILAISLNDAADTVKGGVYLWPREFTLDNYKTVFGYPQLLTAAKVSFLRTVIGTALSVFSSAMLAYTLSRKDFVFRKPFTILFILTMYFSGGMVPEYFLIRDLKLIGNFWVYILPGLIGAWNVIVLRSYIDGLPISLQESAQLDGANDFVIFTRIILPLAVPVIATIALFVAVFQWNSWFDTFLYASSDKNLTTLQYELMKILQNTNTSMNSDSWRTGSNQQGSRVSPQSIRATITIVATVPILIVYPFMQKYFVQGLTLGAVKS